MGDPDRGPVPVDAMLAPARIAEIRASILPGRTFDAAHYGTRVEIGSDAGTQHISAVDAAGNAVALTTTVNTSFGSLVVGRRTGVVFNNEMDDFVARPGEPNAFGLVGSAANAVAPGARPLSSMTPTVLEHPDGRRIVVGASGGPQIISATLQVILAIVDDGLDPSAAVAVPRVHHQWMPRELMADRGVSPDTLGALRGRGHTVAQRPHYSAVQVVVWDRGSGVALGASDPRKGGAPWSPGGPP
jgi:gamma-glutamyltranspeptidase/glutathione hydrolase